MSEQPQGSTTPTRGGDRRDQDRRGGSRRQRDRRTPPPPWRRPWAYIAYGLLGALLLVFVLSRFGEDEEPVMEGLETTSGLPAVDTAARPASEQPVQEASGVGNYERLLAEGEAATGQRVRTVLYCGPVTQITLHSQERTTVAPSIAALADAGGRVPAAECKWGADASAPDFLLLVPSTLAESFAAAPEVELGFVRRRKVPVEVEWIGRSEALAVRIVGVLRAVL